MMGSRRTMLLMNGMYVPFGALMLVMYDKEYFHLYRIYTDRLVSVFIISPLAGE